MLFEAAFWRPDGERPPLDEGLSREGLHHLLAGWGRSGDTAVIAETAERPNPAEPGTVVGAAWYRFWNDDEHSWGYVNARIPELGIGVLPEWRGRGAGLLLLQALTDTARVQGLPALSLSVEKENFAAELCQ